MTSLFNENNLIIGKTYKPDENKYKNDPEGLERLKNYMINIFPIGKKKRKK